RECRLRERGQSDNRHAENVSHARANRKLRTSLLFHKTLWLLAFDDVAFLTQYKSGRRAGFAQPDMRARLGIKIGTYAGPIQCGTVMPARGARPQEKRMLS